MLFSNLDAKVQKIFVNQKFSVEKDLIFKNMDIFCQSNKKA